jgi:hypothetical protein
MPYQVDSSDGCCIYRGNDLELACEIYEATPSATLLISCPQDSERSLQSKLLSSNMPPSPAARPVGLSAGLA